jgi:hypothetical protein
MSMSFLGGTRVAIMPHALTTTTVLLDNPPDSDHDGIPDDLDDCPTVPDATQANSVGSGPGDACRGSSDLAPPPAPLDLLATDLLAADLSVAGVADMSPTPPDLLPGPSLCSSANALFCDGFEAGSLVAPWGPYTVQGSITVDSLHVYRGRYALHVHQNAIASGATGVAISTQAYPSPDIFLRAYVYLPSPAPTGTFTFLRAQMSGNGQYTVDLDVHNGVFTTNASRVSVAETSTTAPPLDRWFCVEWQIHVATNGYTIMKLDGNPVAGLAATNTFDSTNSPLYDWLVVGLDSGAATAIPQRDLWLDEIILDNKAIGCAR